MDFFFTLFNRMLSISVDCSIPLNYVSLHMAGQECGSTYILDNTYSKNIAFHKEKRNVPMCLFPIVKERHSLAMS